MSKLQINNITLLHKFSYSASRILKAILSWSPTWTKFCQLIANLSVILPQHNLTKLKFEYVKFGF